MSPPELLELSSLMYSLAALFASEDWEGLVWERKAQRRGTVSIAPSLEMGLLKRSRHTPHNVTSRDSVRFHLSSKRRMRACD